MENRIITGDALKLDVPDKSVDLIIAHPPYVGVEVTRFGGRPEKQINYSRSHKKIIRSLVKATKEMERVLKDDGSIFIEIGNIISFGTPYHYMSQVLKSTNLVSPNFEYWDYNIITKEPYERLNNHQTIWYHLTKDLNKYYFNPEIPKRDWDVQKDSSVNNEIDKALKSSGFVLDAYPIGWAHKFINMFSRPGDIVLDPFGGSGITAQAALENKRFYITNDISQEMSDLAKKRIKMYQTNPEKYRTI